MGLSCVCVCSVMLPPMVGSSRDDEVNIEQDPAVGFTDHSSERINL